VANKTKILNQAQKFITKGQWDKAIRELQKLIAEDPKDVRTLLKLGDVYSKQGDRESATRVYRQVAESYGEQGFFLKAVAVYKQILKHDPQNLEVTIRLAELYEKLSLGSEAQAQYQNAVKLHEQRGEGGKALQVLEKIVEMEGNNVAARIKLAEGFSKENMLAEAAAQFERAAQTLKEQNRIDDYIKVAERLVYHEPTRVDVLKDVAKILLAKGETKKALAKLQELYKEDTKDIETLHLLARAFTDLGQSQKTIYVFRELARVHQEQGRPVDAATVYQQILQIDPNDPEARQALGYAPGGAPTAAVPSGPLSFGQGRAPGSVPSPPPASGPLPTSAPPAGTAPRGPSLQPRPPSAAPRAPGAAPPPPPPPPSADLGDEDLVMSDGPPPPLAPRAAPRPPPPPPSAPAASTGPSGSTTGSLAAPGSPSERIQKILTETDVFIRYGLRDKALEHLRSVFAIEPDSVAAFEKMRDVHLGTGDREKAAEALGNIIQICTRRGDKEGLDRYRRELAALQPEHPLAAGAVADDGAEAGGEPESISIDISEESGVYDAIGEPGDGSSVEISVSELEAVEDEPDPFAGAVVEEASDEVEELDPFAIQEQGSGPDFDMFADPGAAFDTGGHEDAFASTGEGSSDAMQIPSGVFDVLAPEAPPVPEEAPGSHVLLLEDIEGAEESWFAGTGVPTGRSDDTPDEGPTTTPSLPSSDLEWSVSDAHPGADPAPAPEPAPAPSEPSADLDPAAVAPEETSIEIEAEVEDAAVAHESASLDIAPEPASSADAASAVEEADVTDDLDEAEFMLDTGLEDEARELLRSVLERAPGSERARALLQRAGASSDVPPEPAAGDMPEADEMGPDTRDVNEQVLEMLEADDGEPASEDRFDQGMMYRDLGMYDEAIREFRAAARSDRRSLDSLEMIGHCLVAQGEAKAGIECFRLALSRGASGAAATNLKYEIGAAYEQIHDLDRAARWYRACLDADPNHRDVSIRLGAVESTSSNGVPGRDPATGGGRRGPQSSRKNKISYL
jgi:tetratricopeptide (TPR) repeat protein